MDVFISYLLGALGGIFWALMGAGYHKIGNPDFSFSIINFIKTVIIGAVLGGTSIYYGQSVDIFASSATALSLTAVVDRLLNMFFKKVTN